MSRPTVADLEVRVAAIEAALASLLELLKPFAALSVPAVSPAVAKTVIPRTEAGAGGQRAPSRTADSAADANPYDRLHLAVANARNRDALADVRDDIRAARQSMKIDEQQQIDLVSECVLKSNKLAKGIYQ
jgi:hypothetical protein